jgi:hypothetical protein
VARRETFSSRNKRQEGRQLVQPPHPCTISVCLVFHPGNTLACTQLCQFASFSSAIILDRSEPMLASCMRKSYQKFGHWQSPERSRIPKCLLSQMVCRYWVHGNGHSCTTGTCNAPHIAEKYVQNVLSWTVLYPEFGPQVANLVFVVLLGTSYSAGSTVPQERLCYCK